MAYQAVIGGSIAQLKCKKCLFYIGLHRSEYASSNQVAGGSNPSGRIIYLIYNVFFAILTGDLGAKSRGLSRTRSGAPTAGSVSGSSLPSRQTA
jgi:hypothetical protein